MYSEESNKPWRQQSMMIQYYWKPNGKKWLRHVAAKGKSSFFGTVVRPVRHKDLSTNGAHETLMVSLWKHHSHRPRCVSLAAHRTQDLGWSPFKEIITLPRWETILQSSLHPPWPYNLTFQLVLDPCHWVSSCNHCLRQHAATSNTNCFKRESGKTVPSAGGMLL